LSSEGRLQTKKLLSTMLKCILKGWWSNMLDLKNDYSTEELEGKLLASYNLTQGNWVLDRGANTTKDYIDDEDGKVKIREAYFYTWDEGGRFVENFYKKIFWYDNSGKIIHQKQLKRESVTAKKLKEVNRAICQGRLDYLETAADNLGKTGETLPEPHRSQYIQVANSIDFLFKHYKEETTEYVSRQTMAFEKAILKDHSHVDGSLLVVVDGYTTPDSQALEAHAQTIKGILNITVRQPDEDFPNGLTVKGSILYQLRKEIP